MEEEEQEGCSYVRGIRKEECINKMIEMTKEIRNIL